MSTNIIIPRQTKVTTDTMLRLPSKLNTQNYSAEIMGDGGGINVQIDNTSQIIIEELASILRSAGIRIVSSAGENIRENSDTTLQEKLPQLEESFELANRINALLEATQ